MAQQIKHKKTILFDRKWNKKIKFTKHFIERYYQRVWYKKEPNNYNFLSEKNKVTNDMIFRMTTSEKQLLGKFGSNKCVKLPFEMTKEIIVKKNHLITILN
jgi:hypothetical protein